MVALTFEEEPVASPLGGVEPGLTLGTIVEGKEGSTADESETETLLEPPQEEEEEEATEGPDKEEEGDAGREEEEDNEEEEEEQKKEEGEGCGAPLVAPHRDVDGGWAWVVLVAIFCVFVITSGMLSTTGLYYVQMLNEYGHSRSYTAWMGSLVNAFFMLGGPVSSLFIQELGCRAALMFGSFLMAIGYLASAFITSLEALFFTYGVVVACGMNFSYSGQISALNQYFHKRHSIATSTAMLGIGLGMFFLSSLTEYNIQEYGWRGSYIWNAGLSLQIAVFGALVFPLRLVPAGDPGRLEEEEEVRERHTKSSKTFKGLRTSKSRILYEHSIQNRSLSSLRLSAEASYLSHSMLSLGDSQRHLSLRSNQHSFCSKGSHMVIGSIRSNGQSFSIRDSHMELSHFDLRSNQFSFHQRDWHGEPGLHSNTHSFCSRRDSQAGLNGIKSNPHSFIHHHHPPEGEGESLKGVCVGGRARFMLREGDCDLGCCVEEDPCPSEMNVHGLAGEQRSLCLLVGQKLKQSLLAVLSIFTKRSGSHLFADARFWLLDLGFFFAMVGTMCLFIIYKDFAVSKNIGDYYSMALSGIGIGDLCGRMGTGFMLTSERFHPVLTYSLAMVLCAVTMLAHIFITTGAHFLVVTALFGLLYGSQNVLIAITPSMVFGREKLPQVFGYILFLGGIGALVGAPIAGFIVDSTDSYDGVLIFSSVNLTIGAILMFSCYLVQRSALLHTTQAPEQV